jgi:hypothetical protein
MPLADGPPGPWAVIAAAAAVTLAIRLAPVLLRNRVPVSAAPWLDRFLLAFTAAFVAMILANALLAPLDRPLADGEGAFRVAARAACLLGAVAVGFRMRRPLPVLLGAGAVYALVVHVLAPALS